jgi:hypothetical protein
MVNPCSDQRFPKQENIVWIIVNDQDGQMGIHTSPSRQMVIMYIGKELEFPTAGAP